MQKVITIRSSHGGLEDKLQEYINDGWKIVDTVKGSEWTRVLNTYKWTVTLEKDEGGSSNLGADDAVSQLERAKKLYEDGTINKTEYEALKKKILK